MASSLMVSCKGTVNTQLPLGGWLQRAKEVSCLANITITSKTSNLSLYRLAICDVAAIVSRQSVSGTGMTMARLLNLPYAALRYNSGQYCRQYLLAGMVEYGVNFGTSQALDLVHGSLERMWRA